MKTLKMFIGGKWTLAKDGGVREIKNPANNKVFARVTDGNEHDAEIAIKFARKEFDTGPWPKMLAQDRSALLLKLADAIDKNAEELAKLETQNNGKPFREAQFDIGDAANCFRYYAGLIKTALGQTVEVPFPNMHTMVVREPIGVCGQIIPWNFPFLMAAWKLAPALAAGNCCILKCAETTPLTAIRLFELMNEVGIPAGAAQLLIGAGGTAGHALASSLLVDKIAFTGGTVTGRKIMQAATGNIKKVTLELGGKSPCIVFDDADMDLALDWAFWAAFCGQGEVCSAGSRLLLHRKIADKFLAKFVAAADKIVVGDGLKKDTEMGPLISEAHMEKVLNYINIGKKEGAKLVCGGYRITAKKDLAKGYFVAPTIFTDTKPNMRIVQEEIFGPVLVVQVFKDEAEAISLANNSVYGLAGAVFTQEAAKGLRVLKALRAGITWMNNYHPTFNEVPWGGYKQSGIGRELGTFGLDAYLETKQININLDNNKIGWYKGE
jgi:betaine-aldehyde dehydrogenase